MVQARIAVLALTLFWLSGPSTVAAQEVVLTNGSRLPGVVERYEGGFAYIRIFKEGGKTVLTTMPESAVDKAATQQSQTTTAEAVETDEAATTGPFKLPHNDLSGRGPGIADIAAQERDRREEALDSGAATGRVFKNGQRATGILTGRQIEELGDLREQPQAVPDTDAAALVAGLRFYEARLETLTSVFTQLGQEWEDMWRYCTPVTYVGGPEPSESSKRPSDPSRPAPSYREAVMKRSRRVDDKWSIACVSRDSDLVARGKQVVEVYDIVFNAYANFAQNTGQSSRAVARALPVKPR